MGRESRQPLPFAAANVPIIGQPQPRNPLNRPPQIRDLMRRVLHEGDLITLHTLQPQIFKIEKIEPMVESGAPPGMMKLTAVSVAVFVSERDSLNYEFLRVAQRPPIQGDTPPPPADEANMPQDDPSQESEQ